VKHTHAIGEICRQIIKVCERIDTLSLGIEMFEQGNTDLVITYEGLRFDELEHAQMLTLKLTELITQETADTAEANADEDGSVFGPGELTDVKTGENEAGKEDCDEPDK